MQSLDRRGTVWVVDDSATDANRVCRALESEFDVEVFHDSATALERLGSVTDTATAPDLLLLDWIMPGITGVEFCRYVRTTNGVIKKLPILLLTAQHGTQEVIEAFNSGANDYIVKPFVDEEVTARVKALVSSKRLLERAEQAEFDAATQRRLAETRRLDFYSIIAHDLRTPLNSIMLRIQLALRGKHGLIPDGLTSDLRHVDKSLRSLVGMINDFLDLAKLEVVGYKIARAPVNMSELVNAVLSDFKPLLEHARLDCKKIGLDQAVTVLGDERRLTQVLSNLIGNAIKFTGEKGAITLSAITTEEHVEIAVQDTGRGISKDEQPYVFERFMQSREEGSDSVGSGLGLMIVREIIEAHAGVIGVESEIGVGSRFWFRLPREVQT